MLEDTILNSFVTQLIQRHQDEIYYVMERKFSPLPTTTTTKKGRKKCKQTKNKTMLKFIYVIGLHAVQFGNNWMRKIPRTAKLDSAYGLVQFGSPRNFFNYRVPQNSLFKAKLNARTKTIQFILNWTVCKN